MISSDKLEQYRKILNTKICPACSLGLLIPDDEDLQRVFECSHCGAKFDFRTDDEAEEIQLLQVEETAPDAAEVVETYRIYCEIFRETRFRRIVQAATAFNILDYFDSEAAADIYRKMTGDGDKVAPVWFDAFLGRLADNEFDEETESLLEWFDEEWVKAFGVACMLRPEVEAIRDVVSDALSDVRPEYELPADLVPMRQRAVSQIASLLSVVQGWLDNGEYYVPPDDPGEDDSDSQEVKVAQAPSDGICLACGHVNHLGAQTCSMCGKSVRQEG